MRIMLRAVESEANINKMNGSATLLRLRCGLLQGSEDQGQRLPECLISPSFIIILARFL